MVVMSQIRFQDFPKLCRFCNLLGDLVPLSQCVFVNIFTQLTGMAVQEDGLPENICSICFKVFQDFSYFIDMCKNNTEHLKSIYLKHALTAKGDTVVSEDDLVKDEDNFIDELIDESDEETKPLALLRKYCKPAEKDKIHKPKKPNKTNTYKKHNIKDTPIKKHEEKKICDKNEPKKCDFCGFETTLGEIKEHYKLNTKCRPRNFKCTECDKAFNKKWKLTAHMRSHTKEEPFQCLICQKKFRFAQNLRRHNLVHSGIKRFKCNICLKEFTTRFVLKEHMNIHTGHNAYICSYCGKGFNTYASHYLHDYRHKLMNGEVEKKDSTKKPYLQLQCDVCNKVFASNLRLLNHSILHQDEPRQKKFLCEDCGKGYMTIAELELHSQIHTGDRPYDCSECGKRFRLRSEVKNHKLVHSGKKVHKCAICQKIFKLPRDLKIHFRTHSGEKPYSCTFCDKKFVLNCQLTVHTRMHTGETPYVCSVCKKGFYDSSSLKKHQKGNC